MPAHTWTEPVDPTTDRLPRTAYISQVLENIRYLRDVPDSPLVNKSGGSIGEGWVGVINVAVAQSVDDTTVVGSSSFVHVATETIADNASGRFRTQGWANVSVQGAVAIGDELQTSATAGRAQSGAGHSFAKAYTAFAGPGAGTVLAFIHNGGSQSGGHQLSQNGTALAQQSGVDFRDDLRAVNDVPNGRTRVGVGWRKHFLGG